MTAESPASSHERRIRVVGRGSRADAVRRVLADDFLVVDGDDLAVDSTDPQSTDAGRPVDCVVCVLPEPATTATVESAVRTARTGLPVLAVFPETTPAAAVDVAFEAGATDVVRGVDDQLSERVDWLCRGMPGERPSVADLATTVDAFGDAVCLLDTQWEVKRATAPFASYVGQSQASLVGENLWATWAGGRDLAPECWRAVLAGEQVEFESACGDDCRVEGTAVPLADGLALRIRDVTDHVAAAQSVDRYERILETIDDGVYTLNQNFTITAVNEAVTEMTGYSRDELVGSHATLLADETVIAEAGSIIQEILTGERSEGRLDVELETADGETLPVETRFSALRFADGSYGSVGVIRDIRDRKRYERTLTALNRSVRRLFEAETASAVAETVVATATEVLELESVAVYHFSEADGRLEPTAWNGDDSPPSVGPGDGALWQSFVEREVTSVATDADSFEDWNDLEAGPTDADTAGGVALPLGAHGLLVTATSARNPRREHETLARLLAANAEAALDRVERSTELARRKEELARRNEELSHLNRFNELLRGVNRVLVEADSREAIEQAVCERLVDSSSIAFAWIGGYDAADGSLTPRVWAGTERGYLDFLTDFQDAARADGRESDRVAPDANGNDASTATSEPSVMTAQSGASTVVDNVAQSVQQQPWRREALSREFAAVASVPLLYHEFSYGVLTVYATEPHAFDEQTQLMFEELGITTANAINGVEAKASLHTESVVELDLHIESPNAPLFRLARTVGDALRLEGTVSQPGDATLVYLSVTGDDVDLDALASLVAVDSVSEVATRDGTTLVEVRTAVETLPSRLADLGASVRQLTADSEALTAVVELPHGSDVREFVETIREAYPGTELTAKRTRERPVETPRAFRATLEEALTDRQLEALRTAYLSGYFNWPRERTGRDIADTLGIAQPTFARHLRVAERKLFERLFAE